LPEQLSKKYGSSEVYVYMDLYHGDSREARLETKPVEANIAIVGSYKDWCKVIKRELHPIMALLSGKLKVKSDVKKIIRFASAAIAMVNCSKKINAKTL